MATEGIRTSDTGGEDILAGTQRSGPYNLHLEFKKTGDDEYTLINVGVNARRPLLVDVDILGPVSDFIRTSVYAPLFRDRYEVGDSFTESEVTNLVS
jgi:hypothetical protein